jgi:ABC-2 type transport system ATP-binding protein
MSDPVLEFDGVHRWFGAQHVLRGLSFRVAPGEVYALLGRNGAGKTTALRILLGLLAPLRGAVRRFGVDVAATTARERARIGHVGEEHRLWPTMSVGGALAFEADLRPGFRREFAERALRRCGLRTDTWIPRLSRGQRAQLCLVLAVAGGPELLVCDDPALGLDVVMRRELLDVLIDLLAETGCSVLFSSHFLCDVERIADRIGILHEGRLVVDATLDDVKTRVRRGSWIPRGDTAPPAGTWVLRCVARRGGHDVTLVDADDARLAALRAGGELSALAAPTLEELFLDLTGPDRPGLLAEATAELAPRAAVGGG